MITRTLLLVLTQSAGASRAWGGVEWLSGEGLVPVLRADPGEPRSSLSWFPGEDHMAVALGGGVPILRSTGGSGAWATFLEGGVDLELLVMGDKFPLETVDGTFGLRAEGSRGFGRAVLRLRHLSAHRADGDSAVSYPGTSVSRETWNLELGAAWPEGYVYGRLGSAWHAVPEVEGANAAVGLEGWLARDGWRPVAGLQWAAEASSGHRPQWALFLGLETTGRHPLRAGLRWQHGPGPSAQVEERTVDRWGLEIQLVPLPVASP